MILKSRENVGQPLGGLQHCAERLQHVGGGKGRLAPQRALRTCFRRSSVFDNSLFSKLLTDPSIIPLILSRNAHKVSDKADFTESFHKADDTWRGCHWEGDIR
jgi:hypothetical protein